MDYRESLEICLRDSRFLLNVSDLRSLLPGIEDVLPPLTAIRFADRATPRFIWGFPVVHGARLLLALHQLLTRELSRCLASPSYQENLRALTPAELKEEPYFLALSDCLLKSLAEGVFLRLDSVLWIYLADAVNSRLNQEDGAAELVRQVSPADFQQLKAVDAELARLRYRDPRRYADIRVKALRSIFARNDFANSCMKDVYDEVPNSPLNREMIANRLVYTERPEAIYRQLEVGEAFLIRGYKFTATDFTGINRVLRLIISSILARAGSGKLLTLDAYFLKHFFTDEVRQKALLLPPQGVGLLERGATPKEVAEAEEREKIAFLLAVQPEPVQYLLHHLDLDDKEYFRVVERYASVPKEVVKALRFRNSAVILEQLYSEVCRDLLRWDFFQSLKGRLRYMARDGERQVCEDRPVARSVVSLNLDSYYEMYRRSRRGTAVFFDLIGFTARTKQLTRELQEEAARGDKERFDLSSISLAIQRIFRVRNSLDQYGGIPQGFEGDAILDMFPRALDALRYVAAFVENYSHNTLIRFRPFERPTPNPYADGFRVGLATGDYSLISIVGRANDLSSSRAQERAVGHTVNRASRLNSGKKGDPFLLLEDEQGKEPEVYDPFSLFNVRITPQRQLHNDGIASYEDTFQEIFLQVKGEGLPYYCPATGEGALVAGVTPRFRHYDFELIFEDARMKRVVLVRKVPGNPDLKGLEDELVVVYEYLLMEPAELLALLQRDASTELVPHARPPAPGAVPVATAVAGPASAPTVREAASLAGSASGARGRQEGKGSLEAPAPVRASGPGAEALATGILPRVRPTRRLAAAHGTGGKKEKPARPWFKARAVDALPAPETTVGSASPGPPLSVGTVSVGTVSVGTVSVGSVSPGTPLSVGPVAAGTPLPSGTSGASLGGRARLPLGGFAGLEDETGEDLLRPLRGQGAEDSAPAGLGLGREGSAWLSDEGELGGAPRGPVHKGGATSGPGVSRGGGAVEPPWSVPVSADSRGPYHSEEVDLLFSLEGATPPRPAAEPPWEQPVPSTQARRADPGPVEPGQALEALFGEEAEPSETYVLEVDEEEEELLELSAGAEEDDASPEAASSGVIMSLAADPSVSPDGQEREAGRARPSRGGAEGQAAARIHPAVIEIEWRGLPEIRELVDELRRDDGEGESRIGVGTYSLGGRGRRVESLVPSSRGGVGDLELSKALQGYVYTFSLGREPHGTKVLIGKPGEGALEDVHAYATSGEGREPWSLDGIFTRFLEDKAREGFRQELVSRVLLETLETALTPLPLLYLERLFRRMKSR